MKTRSKVKCYLCHEERECYYYQPFCDSLLCEECLARVRAINTDWYRDKIKMKVLNHKYYLRRRWKDDKKVLIRK